MNTRSMKAELKTFEDHPSRIRADKMIHKV